jgi:hypothetical protein
LTVFANLDDPGAHGWLAAPQLITCVRGITLMGSDSISPASLDHVANVLQQYCDDLLEELTASLPPTLNAETAGAVRICYTDLILNFARSLRDAEVDPGRRHAVAQPIQQKVLEAERRLIQFLDAATASDRPSSTDDDGPRPGVSSPNRS